MIPTKILKQKTGLSQTRLNYMIQLGLLPHPTRIPSPGRHGSAYAYPATIFTRIRMIDFLQSHGLTLTQIVHAAKGTPFQCPPGELSQ